MSLPSAVLFFKDGVEVARVSCNIGWFDNDDLIGGCVLRAINETVDFLENDKRDHIIKKDLGDGKWELTYLNGITKEPMSTHFTYDMRKIDFDTLQAYSRIITRENFHKWYTKKITDEEFIKTFELTQEAKDWIEQQKQKKKERMK